MGEEKTMDWPAGDWFLDQESPGDLVAVKKEEVAAAGQTSFQSYEIFVSSLWGKALILDGRLQSAEVDEFVYHEALVHPVMVAHPEPRRGLILGGGEGATLREVLRHPPVTQAVMVDIDEELVNICRQLLPTFHRGALDDPRATLIFTDGAGPVRDLPSAATHPTPDLIAENAAAGTAVGLTAAATDPDAGDTVTYSVDDARFAIDANGIITLAAAGALDFETEPSITLNVTATSSDTSTAT